MVGVPLNLTLCISLELDLQLYKEDYFWEFSGWNNIPSRVHLRLVHEQGKPFIVICSQPLFGAGTSTQNAYKIVKKHIWGVLVTRLDYHDPSEKLYEIHRLKDALKSSKSITTAVAAWALEKLLSLFNRESYHPYRLLPELNAVWLEHWPPGTDLLMGPPDDYLLVRENKQGERVWSRIDIERFSRLIGYEPNLLAVPLSVFENDSRKQNA